MIASLPPNQWKKPESEMINKILTRNSCDGEIPMSEAEEKYAATIISGSTILRQWQVGAGPLVYTRADQLTDIAAFPANLTFEVAQISAVYGPGIIAELPFVLDI